MHLISHQHIPPIGYRDIVFRVINPAFVPVRTIGSDLQGRLNGFRCFFGLPNQKPNIGNPSCQDEKPDTP